MTTEIQGVGAPDLSLKSNEELAGEITLLAAHIQAATCRLLMLVAEMDRREAFGDLHFKSCAHWLSFCTGDSLPTAREKVRVARKLEECPVVQQAFSEGRVSYSKVRAITRIISPENEETLLEFALGGSTSQLERIVRTYRRLAPAEQELTTRQHERRYLSYHYDDDNMLVLRGRLPPEVGALVVKALAKAGELAECEDSSEPSQWLCDALGEVAGAALDRGLAQRAGKDRPNSFQVMVHVDEAVLRDGGEQGRCEVEGGIGASGETLRRLTCDTQVVEVHDADCANEGEGCGAGRHECKLRLGRSRRRAGAPLERAVRVRDQGVCQFPGCESRGFLHMHHLEHWADGGPTNLENLTLLCSFHHRAVHEGGYSVVRDEQGELCFRTPAGLTILSQAEPVILDRPVDALVAEHDGMDITPETGRAGWDGILPVDYAGAVGHLLELGSSSLATPNQLQQ